MEGSFFNIAFVYRRVFVFFSLDYRNCLCMVDTNPFSVKVLPLSSSLLWFLCWRGVWTTVPDSLKAYLPIFSMTVLFESYLENTSFLGGHKNSLQCFFLKVYKNCAFPIYIFNLTRSSFLSEGSGEDPFLVFFPLWIQVVLASSIDQWFVSLVANAAAAVDPSFQRCLGLSVSFYSPSLVISLCQ